MISTWLLSQKSSKSVEEKRVGFMLEKLLEEGQVKLAKPKDLSGSGGL